MEGTQEDIYQLWVFPAYEIWIIRKLFNVKCKLLKNIDHYLFTDFFMIT